MEEHQSQPNWFRELERLSCSQKFEMLGIGFAYLIQPHKAEL